MREFISSERSEDSGWETRKKREWTVGLEGLTWGTQVCQVKKEELDFLDYRYVYTFKDVFILR